MPSHLAAPTACGAVAERWGRGVRSKAGGLIVACLAATACGSSGSTDARSAPGPPGSTARPSVAHVVIATKTIERAIERSSWAQRGLHVTADCPAKVLQRKGIVFDCTAVYHGRRTVFTVTELDGSGDVHYVAH